MIVLPEYIIFRSNSWLCQNISGHISHELFGALLYAMPKENFTGCMVSFAKTGFGNAAFVSRIL